MIDSDAFGFMAHGGGSLNVLDGTVVRSQFATFLLKAGGVEMNLEHAEIHNGGVLVQMIDDLSYREDDMQALADFSKVNDNVDFAGRIVWAEVNGKRTEVFNFGKHKGLPVADVLRMDPGYYSWILGGDFTYNTKQVLTRIRLREAQR